MNILLPSMFQLSFTDVTHIFICIQHPRTICNIVQLNLFPVWPAYKLAPNSVYMDLDLREVGCFLVLGKEMGSKLSSLKKH